MCLKGKKDEIKNKLINEYPDIKRRALRYLEYVKSANIAKIIALKGCKNCRLIVCEKLDVKKNDLCDDCKNLIAKYTKINFKETMSDTLSKLP